MKGDIPKDRDGRSKGTKAKKSIFGEQVRHPLAGPRGLEAEGDGGFCREEIRLLGRGPPPPYPVPTCQAAKTLSSSFGLFQGAKSHRILVLEAGLWLPGGGHPPWTPAHPETASLCDAGSGRGPR